jgi:hypothetical protein
VLTPEDRAGVTELVPALRRAVRLDDRAVARLRLGPPTGTGPATATVLVRLPFGVLVSRTVHITDRTTEPRDPIDVTVRAAEALAWFDDPDVAVPEARDAEWRAGRPPEAGWRRVDSVPEEVVRRLVRHGALALQEAAAREGAPGAQPRAAVAEALLDATVLTVHDDAGASAAVTLRALSALVRMAFLPRGGQIHIDIAGRWIRVVGGYGSVYLERTGQQLTLR